MKLNRHNGAPGLVAALLIALLLFTQAGIAGHIHSDGLSGSDCLQCQLEGGQGAIAAPIQVSVAITAVSVDAPAVALAPALPVYSQPARGPPVLSF